MDTIRSKSSLMLQMERWGLGRRTSITPTRTVMCAAILFLTLFGQNSLAQGVGIGESTFSPDASAILELRYMSGPYKGFLVPRMTSANRTGISSPATGLMVYDTDVQSFHYYDGGWIAIPGGQSILGAANGGTGQTTYAIGDILYASASTTLSKLPDVAAGSYLRSGGVTTAPLWSALTLPNAATTGDLFYASGSNAMGNLADVAVGRVLISGGVGAAPSYSATPALGVAGSTLGTLSMSGNTSGTIVIQPQAAAGAYNFNLPTSAGSSGQPLLSGGGGATAMSFGTLGAAAGGTGIANNAASTLTISGNFATTLTLTNTTSVTLPTSGTLYGTAANSVTSAQLSSSLSDETGTGSAVFSASPTFTGTPTLPTGTIATTQTFGDNTTALATTAFVQSETPVYSRVTGSNATTTGQTLVDITGLTYAASAAATYEFEAVLSVSTSAVASGTGYGVQYTGTASAVEAQITGSNTSTATKTLRINALNTSAQAFLTTSSQTGGIIIKGIIVTTTAGNLTIRHLKVTNGTSTVFINSFLKVTRVQ